jgi:hypothetical protein
MKKYFVLAALTIATALTSVAPYRVSADTASDTEVVCETGAYGQTTCRTKTKRVVKPVKMVDTSLNSLGQLLVIAAGSISAVSAAYLIRRK